jgi:gamma-glutamyltranspeptidase/glutathione hydrolase
MMCPAMVGTADGALTALGSGGSNRIRSAILQTVLRLCRPEAALGEAIAAPRLHPEAGHLDFEDRFDGETRAALVAAFPDHRGWAEPSMFFGGVHAVRRAADGTLEGAGDARRDGVVV